jgi:Helitron helicase-like domain at N-terminus
MADNHWHDLHQVLSPGRLSFATEKEAAAFRRKMVRDNPHVVQDFFQLLTKAMLDTFFGPKCFEAQWWWMRFELQQRGAFHVHGCARLMGAPEMTDLGKMVHEGRMAQRVLQGHNIHLQPGESFGATQISMDIWVFQMERDDENFPILEYEDGGKDISQIASLKQTVKQGLTAEYQIRLMHEMLLTKRCQGTGSRSSDRL